MSGFSEYDRSLLGAPSLVPDEDYPRCCVCGRPASNMHHTVFKGMGGLPHGIERKIPLVPLCGMGNTGGCHGLVHHRNLFLRFAWDADEWQYLYSVEPMTVDEAWASDGWVPIQEQRLGLERVYRDAGRE